MLLNLRRLPVLGLLIGGVFITGCHSMVTTKMFDEGMVASYQKESDGIEYFLPKKLLRVTVNRKIVPSDIVKKTAKAAEDAKAKAEEAEKAWKVAKETAEMATKVAGKVDTDGVEKAKRLAAIRKAEADVLEEKAKTAKTAAENALKAAEAASADNQAVEIAVDARTVADLAMKKAEIAKSKYEEEEKAVLEKGVDKGKLDAAIDSLRALQIAELKLKESKGKLGEAEAAAKKDPTDMGAQENLKDAKSKYKAAEEKVGITQGLLDKRVKESEVAREFISRIEKLETEKTKLEAKKKEASDQAEQALKAAGLAMVVIDEKKYEDEISIEELPLIADTSQRFVADLNHRIWREDTLKLTTTPNGLLQTTEGESSDKSGEIIKTLAQTAKEVFKAMAGLPSGATPLTAEEEKVPEKKLCPEYPGTEVLRGIQKKPFSAQYTFDPTNPEKVDEVNKEFCKLGTKFIILVTAVDGQSDQTSTPASVKLRKMQDKSVQCKEKTPLEINGLVYRRATPYTIEVRERQEYSSSGLKTEDLIQGVKGGKPSKSVRDRQIENSFSHKSVQVALPNNSPVSRLSMKTGWFISTKYGIGFDNGMLTKLEVTRPSELYGLVQIPLEIIRDIVSLPTELIQLKLNYSSADTQLLEAQKKNLETQEELKKTLSEIQASKDSEN